METRLAESTYDMRWRRPAAAFAAGLLLTAALPPFGWWPLAIVGVALLVHLLEDEEARASSRRLVVGYAAALGFLVPGLWWMHEFTAPGYVLACLFESVLLTIGVAIGRGWTLPAGIVVAESLRASWPFGGVPVPTIAQTQADGPLAPLARVGGELLLAATVLVLGVALAHACRRRWTVAAALVGAVVVLTSFAHVAPRGHRVGTLDIAAVQGGGPRGTRAINTDDALVYLRHLEATDDVPRGVDLVLWPEDVVDVDFPILTTPEGEQLSELADRLHATLVAGVVEGGQAEHQDTVFINFSQAWGPDGTPLGRYEKNRRVPFGEFIPFRSIIEKLGDVSAVPRDARIGHGHGTIDTPSGRMGVVISWEVFFSDRARDAIAHGGQVLLGPTNAASFSNAQMPSLELAAARLRAIETGRWSVQAAPTGFSAVISPTGHVRVHSDLGARAVLRSTVDRRAGQTIYTRVGDGPFFLTALGLVLVGMGKKRWRHER
ncbi:MAG: apolipoprotein N-acyltransferase [Actinomycetota bacterium]|jgi:apolipoprotein N-acyltransferase|nr:apolipoprotein N-acyltransferase [Actinomycetota bacterium]